VLALGDLGHRTAMQLQMSGPGGVAFEQGACFEPPDEYCCPIARELMLGPVLLVGSGHTYKRLFIQAARAQETQGRSVALPDVPDPLSHS
jgi:hypothetical protein